jgi:NAD-dependent deacetylase
MSDIHIPPALINKLHNAKKVVVLTGAGISAESGIPTFRDALTGLWSKFDPHELATVAAFQRNPKLVWDWYAHRRQMNHQAAPNAGHFALVEMAKLVPNFTLITQNIDGLHQQAGSQNVIELHGSIVRVKCLDNHHPCESWSEMGDLPPRCPICDSYLRPDVVWFGEMLPEKAIQTAFARSAACDLFFSIGTSAMVQPAASLPVEALQNGATVVEVNLDDTPLTRYVSFAFKGRSGEIMPAILEKMRS